MTPPLAEVVEEGRRLAEAATPGPWEEGGPWPTVSVIYQTFAGWIGPEGGQPPEYDLVCIIWQGVDHTGRMVPEHPDRSRHLADAAFIAFARTALPRLLAVAEAAVEYRAAVEAESEARFNGYVPMALADRLEWAERAFDAAARGEK